MIVAARLERVAKSGPFFPYLILIWIHDQSAFLLFALNQ